MQRVHNKKDYNINHVTRFLPVRAKAMKAQLFPERSSKNKSIHSIYNNDASAKKLQANINKFKNEHSLRNNYVSAGMGPLNCSYGTNVSCTIQTWESMLTFKLTSIFYHNFRNGAQELRLLFDDPECQAMSP